MSSFAVKFLGCKVSQADVMLARSALLAAGHTEAPEAEADLHVINTCCITSEAEAKSRQSVRRSLAHADRVIVTGCAVNLDGAQFAAIDGRVQPLVGTSDDVAASLGPDAGGCVDLEHGLLEPAAAVQASPRRRGHGVSSRSKTDATACAPTASFRRSVATHARVRPAPCSRRCDAGSPRASPRWC